MADLIFQEKRTAYIEKQEEPCKHYPKDNQGNIGFASCCRTSLWYQLMSRINCTIAQLEDLMDANINYSNNNNENTNLKGNFNLEGVLQLYNDKQSKKKHFILHFILHFI